MNRFISLIINILVLILRILIPKNKKLAIVGSWSGNRFADNSKYYFTDYVNSYHSCYTLYWITRNTSLFETLKNHGIPVVYAKSLKGFWLHLRAQYHIIDHSYNDILGYLSLTATRINLWHGLPMKRIWRANSNKSVKWLSFILGDLIYDNLTKLFFPGGWNDFRLCVPSDFSANNLFKYCVSKRQLQRSIRCSYPRVDFLRNRIIALNLESSMKLIEKITSIHFNGGKVIIYMPTFRDTQNTSVLGASNINDVDNFFNLLREHNIYLLIKPHPADKVLSSFVNENVIMIPSQIDAYPILKYSDMLITDYSSIFFDYSVLDKPIIFYAYDYDYYKNTDRGILFDFENFDIGPKVYKFSDLFNHIVRELKESNYSKQRNDFANSVFQNDYPTLNDFLLRQINKNKQ